MYLFFLSQILIILDFQGGGKLHLPGGGQAKARGGATAPIAPPNDATG